MKARGNLLTKKMWRLTLNVREGLKFISTRTHTSIKNSRRTRRRQGFRRATRQASSWRSRLQRSRASLSRRASHRITCHRPPSTVSSGRSPGTHETPTLSSLTQEETLSPCSCPTSTSLRLILVREARRRRFPRTKMSLTTGTSRRRTNALSGRTSPNTY